MKIPAFLSMPWDMVVFLTITTVGFAFAMQKLRNPAHIGLSASALGSPTQVVETNRPTLDLGCVDSRAIRKPLVNAEPTVRIKGRFCELNKRQMRFFGGVRVKNVTNGKEGTVFMKGFDSSFVTDLVSLNEGKNVIEVAWQTSEASPIRLIRTEIFEKESR